MRKLAYTIWGVCCVLGSVAGAQVPDDSGRTADWENHHVLQINREPARAAFFGYDKKAGDRLLSLNGTWKFHWSPTPQGRVKDFYRLPFNDSSWTDFKVPANWENNGYGTPIYVSAGYPFRIDPPRVMSEPKKTYTTFVERNPVGQYRREFACPAHWQGSGQTFLRFDGAMSAFYVWINGALVGYSQGSMEPSEFNVTRYLNKGKNLIAVEVYKYSDGRTWKIRISGASEVFTAALRCFTRQMYASVIFRCVRNSMTATPMPRFRLIRSWRYLVANGARVTGWLPVWKMRMVV